MRRRKLRPHDMKAFDWFEDAGFLNDGISIETVVAAVYN